MAKSPGPKDCWIPSNTRIFNILHFPKSCLPEESAAFPDTIEKVEVLYPEYP